MKPIIKNPKQTKAEREAAYIAAYQAHRRGERKCPSRYEFGVSSEFAHRTYETFKTKG